MKVKPTAKVAQTANLKPKKNLAMVVGIAVLIVLLAGGVYFGLSNVLATESYYVLNADTPAKTQITETMLKEVVTAKNSAPQNAITIAQIRQGNIFTKYPLKAGDVLSASNTGLSLDTGTGIPDTWVVTSFNVNADDAVGGNITKGDYFDIIGVSSETGAKYIFTNVLALEVNSGQSTTLNGEGEVTGLGETLQYVVGMPADNVAQLQHALLKYEKIKLVLSPTSLKYKSRDVSPLNNTFQASQDNNTIDLFNGTDNTFSAVLKDGDGVPITIENCEANLVSPEKLCEEIGYKKSATSTTQSSSKQTETSTTEDVE